MNPSEANDKIPTAAEAAWERLQKQLVKEPVNAQWVRWSKQVNEQANQKAMENGNNFESIPSLLTTSAIVEENASYELNHSITKASKNQLMAKWMKRNTKWISGAIAASVMAVTLFTPIGNQALASILGKFRMEQITVVQEDDINQIMNSVFTDGQSRDAVNKFGAFSHGSGTLSGEYTLADAEKALNHKLIMPKDWDLNQNKLYISPSSEITLNLHVDEVNKALQRLGAKKLLPASIDNKPVKLIFGESVSVYQQVKVDGLQRGISFTQMATPSIEVDPSIPVEEAMNAVLQFPFLPDYIKDSLKNSGVLDNGKLPLPIIANGTAEKRTIEDVDVVLTQREYNMSGSKGTEEKKVTNYELTWVKNGQLYNINGSGFTDANAVFAAAKGLIQQ